MHPILEEMQRARDVSPRMVGHNGRWTRELIAYERELLEQIARLNQELQGVLSKHLPSAYVNSEALRAAKRVKA